MGGRIEMRIPAKLTGESDDVDHDPMHKACSPLIAPLFIMGGVRSRWLAVASMRNDAALY
jgi:hypothetical protein